MALIEQFLPINETLEKLFLLQNQAVFGFSKQVVAMFGNNVIDSIS